MTFWWPVSWFWGGSRREGDMQGLEEAGSYVL